MFKYDACCCYCFLCILNYSFIAACCGWDLSNHKRLPLDSKSSLVLSVCMEAVDDQLWVGCSNMINIVDPVTFVVKVVITFVLCDLFGLINRGICVCVCVC